MSRTANRPTIKDVAAASGVSTATVSRVLSGGSRVSQDLTARVMRVVNELGYSPNGLTRGVFQGRSNSIGVLVGDLRSHFYVELVRGAEQLTTQAGSSILLADTSRNPSSERRLLGVMDEQRVRGLLTTTGPDNDDLTRRMASRGTQCVLLTRAPSGAHQRVHSVRLDDVDAGALAATHLHALGRRRIAVLTTTLRLPTQRFRLDGVRSAVRAMAPDASVVSVRTSATVDPPTVAAVVTEVLAVRHEGRRADAIVCTSGRLALGVVGALRTAGVRVPDDLSLVAFDDFPWAPFIDPPMTVVDQRPYEMGVRAAELILAEDRVEPEEIVIPPALIVRLSCGAPAAAGATLRVTPPC